LEPSKYPFISVGGFLFTGVQVFCLDAIFGTYTLWQVLFYKHNYRNWVMLMPLGLKIWGVTGLIMAIPITVFIKDILNNFLKPNNSQS